MYNNSLITIVEEIALSTEEPNEGSTDLTPRRNDNQFILLLARERFLRWVLKSVCWTRCVCVCVLNERRNTQSLRLCDAFKVDKDKASSDTQQERAKDPITTNTKLMVEWIMMIVLNDERGELRKIESRNEIVKLFKLHFNEGF